MAWKTQLNGMQVIPLVKPNVKIADDVDRFMTNDNVVQDGGKFIGECLPYNSRTMTTAAESTVTTRKPTSRYITG
jgi:hypothetical protein